MKLSLSNFSANQYLTYGETLHSTLQAIRECGFRYTDLDILPEYLENDLLRSADQIKAELSATGLTAATAHAPCLNPLRQPEITTKAMIHSLCFCARIGIPRLVIHPGTFAAITRDEFFSRNVEFYRTLLPYAEKSGVEILIENIGNYADPFYLWNGHDLRSMIDGVNHPLVKACWDIGHANHFYEKDCKQYDSIIALGDKLAAIHAHDNCGYIADTYKHLRLDMHSIPYFAAPASVNWDAVIQGLIDIHYSGTFNFEVKTPAKSERADFIYHGEVVRKLEMMPFSIWKTVNTALYAIGKTMLETYGVFEE